MVWQVRIVDLIDLELYLGIPQETIQTLLLMARGQSFLHCCHFCGCNVAIAGIQTATTVGTAGVLGVPIAATSVTTIGGMTAAGIGGIVAINHNSSATNHSEAHYSPAPSEFIPPFPLNAPCG
jgi:hypothetical protein